jgi:ABC-type amino acid transport substrate-binding protein
MANYQRLATLGTVIVVAAMALGACGSTASSGSSTQITLKAGTDPTYQPLAFYDKDHNLVGFDVDIAESLVQHMNAKLSWSPMSFDGLIPALNASQIDFEPEIAVTAKRQAVVDFTDPIFAQTNTTVVSATRTDLNPSITDLKSLKVGVTSGTSAASLLDSIKGLNVTPYNTTPDSFNDLTLGRIDAVVIDSISAGYLVSHVYQGKLRVSSQSLTGSIPIATAVRKGNSDLTAKLNKAIAAMKSDGSLAKITAKWFGKNPS